jgi:hypothetical protein
MVQEIIERTFHKQTFYATKKPFIPLYKTSPGELKNGLLIALSSMVQKVIDKNISLTNPLCYQEAIKAIVKNISGQTKKLTPNRPISNGS